MSIAVSYSSDPSASNTSFIPKFSVQDNGSEDRNPQDGKIRLVLPKAFDKTGVYLIEVEDPRLVVKLVHEPNTNSYFRQFVDWLVGGAGGGERGFPPKSALERIEEVTKGKGQDRIAIWTVPMPAVNQEIDPQSLKLSIGKALMPSWSRNGNYLVCSVWSNGKWIIAAYAINGSGVATLMWQWNPQNTKSSSDFSPAWSPDGDAVAFVRLTEDQKSDIWLLPLNKNRRPRREVKITDSGNVQAVLGWDKDIGLLFETKSEKAGDSSSRQVWATRISTETTDPRVQAIALSDSYSLVRGSAPLRRSIIYAKENDSPPISVLYEMHSTGKLQTLLIEEACSHRWPTVSHNERWLAFESDCPR